MAMKLLIYGKGGHSKVVADAASRYKITFADDLDLPNLKCPSDWWDRKFIVAIGDNHIRFDRHHKLIALGYEPTNIFHPTAFVSERATLGKGIYVGPNASICADAVLKDCVIVNTNASVDHDCCLGLATHVAPGAHLCGGVYVDQFSLIGVGASLIPSVRIGKNTTVAAGSVVIDNVPDDSLVTGVPAKQKA